MGNVTSQCLALPAVKEDSISFAIYCVGRNYADHIKELGNRPFDQPAIFMKPCSSLVTDGRIVIPTFTKSLHYETELVIRLKKDAYQVNETEARSCFDEITIGLDLTARDLQAELKKRKFPWLLSKGFKGAATCSDFIKRITLPEDISFAMTVNGEVRQTGHLHDMIHPIPHLISFISQYCALCAGDLIYTGTPSGVGPLAEGDDISLFIEGRKMDHYKVAS